MRLKMQHPLNNLGKLELEFKNDITTLFSIQMLSVKVNLVVVYRAL